MQITGKLHAIFETKQITERFQKREFVVETADNPSYPQMVLFQLTGDRTLFYVLLIKKIKLKILLDFL